MYVGFMKVTIQSKNETPQVMLIEFVRLTYTQFAQMGEHYILVSNKYKFLIFFLFFIKMCSHDLLTSPGPFRSALLHRPAAHVYSHRLTQSVHHGVQQHAL